MRLKKEYIPLLLGIAMAVGVLIGAALDYNKNTDQVFASNSKKDKLNRLIDYIDYQYVETVNTDSIVDVTVNGILENLDPHSVYIPKDEYEENADDMRGNFTGIGVSFYVYKDSIAVIRAIEGGPAAKAGIKGGDRILTADNKKLHGKTLSRDSIPFYLKGKRGSKVALQVYRAGDSSTKTIKVRRNDVPLISVDASYMVNDTLGLGYIKLNRFSETTLDEFKVALEELKQSNVTSIILDLRGNPGGYIETAEKIVDEFLEDDKLILITKNKSGKEKKTYATSSGDFENNQIYILIDENSASASEIIAGAMQDNDKGIIVGRRSFGKGLVQREMALGDGSAVRLTIARYYTPTGRSIQRPYGNGNEAYYNDYQKRYEDGELINANNIVVADSLKFKTPGGRIVYGGGGIIPDVFVAKDTSLESQTLDYIANSGTMSYFVFEYIDKNRSQFKGKLYEDFAVNYVIDTDFAQQFIDYIAAISGATLNVSAFDARLHQLLKAAIAEQIYGPEASEKLLNKEDAMIKKVIELEQENQQNQGY